MTVIDTSFLIALQNEDDRFHREAVQAPILQETGIIPAEIWTEYCWVLSRIPKGPTAEHLLSVLDGPMMVRAVLTSEETAHLAAEVPRYGARMAKLGFRPLSFFDVVVCTVAARLGESVRTFDEGMQAAIRARFFPGARVA